MPTLAQMQQDIYLGIYDADPGGGGGGTWDSPYYAGKMTGLTDIQNANLFDGIMNDPTKIKPGQCVRLLPGTFFTKGHSGDANYASWAAQDKLRILGSGMGATTLKLLTAAGLTRYAVGMNFDVAGAGLTGFELSDLTIDCNLPTGATSSTAAGAVRVRGAHIFLRRVKVINYGGKVTRTPPAVPIVTVAGDDSENCVIEDCVADIPGTAHDVTALVFCLEGTGNGHRFCAIRNCAVKGKVGFDNPAITADRVRAIWPGIGLGTIIEGNQIVNCSAGVSYDPAIFGPSPTGAAKDIVIWNNVLRNVSTGVWFQKSIAAVPIGRLVVTDNLIELATTAGSLSGGGWQTGLRLNTTQTGTQFTQLVLRKNLIADAQNPGGVTSGLKGLNLQRCGDLVVENNIINHVADTEAVRAENCTNRTFFNNQNSAGKLLRGFDGTNFHRELEDDVQDVILPA